MWWRGWSEGSGLAQQEMAGLAQQLRALIAARRLMSRHGTIRRPLTPPAP